MALELLHNDKVEAAAKAFAAVQESLPSIQGTINGEPFAGFTETDSTLAFFIEAIEYERYLWVPIAAIRELVVSKPETLIDLLWAKGRITTWEGLTMGCFLPVLYPNSSESQDNKIRLGRLTDWQPLGGGFARATGQHVFQVGEEDKSLLELGEVIFKLADA
jgi:type VI secretion system protein ImpE